MLETFLINLDRAGERLAAVDRQLSALGIAYQRVSAVDGKSLVPPVRDFDEAGYRRLHGRRFHPGEVGCYLSHIKVLRQFLAGRADHALVLEDDVEFADDFNIVLAEALKHSSQWDVLRLSTVSTGWTRSYLKLTNRYSLAVAFTRYKGAGAYIVSREAAEIFLDRLLPAKVAWDIAFDIEYMFGLRASIVLPVPVNQVTSKPSQIQINNAIYKLPPWRYLTVLPWRSWIEINRVIRRLRQWFAQPGGAAPLPAPHRSS